MPGGDRTGPNGMGPMTGRAAGYCAGYASPGFMNASGRGFFGFGGGRGGGRGHRNWFHATGLYGWQRAGFGPGPVPVNLAYQYTPYGISSDQEIEMLKAQSETLTDTLSNIQKRIQELEEKTKSK